MKRLFLVSMLAAVVAAPLALAQVPGVVTFRADNRAVLTDCPADGGATVSVTRGQYLLRVLDADADLCVYVDGGIGCSAALAAAQASKLAKDTTLIYRVPPAGQGFACRSFDGGADVVFTRVDVTAPGQ